jgi:hypothetical protein
MQSSPIAEVTSQSPEATTRDSLARLVSAFDHCADGAHHVCHLRARGGSYPTGGGAVAGSFIQSQSGAGRKLRGGTEAQRLGSVANSRHRGALADFNQAFKKGRESALRNTKRLISGCDPF